VSEKKSGLKIYEAGELVFKHNEPARSLYIIQKGQIRLFIPKGRGFVELAVLRAGEVIGEMGYFDEESNRRRSCSAEAILPTEIIEVSYDAFGKTMESLNPWFKTIINTLAGRLRKTNERVKQLENNSLGFGSDGKVSDYKFFHNAEIVKILSVLFFVFKTHGEEKENCWEVTKAKLRFYLNDVYVIPEVKYENFFNLLVDEKIITISDDETGTTKIFRIENPDYFKDQMLFINSQRVLEDNKKIVVNDKCEQILLMVKNYLVKQKTPLKDMVVVNLGDLIQSSPEFGIKAIRPEDLQEAVDIGFCSEVLVGDEGKLVANFFYSKIIKFMPSISLINAIRRFNESKGH
jgi:CRP/FNR family cyclic AMP-dependent transcriptional regulator